MYSIGEIAKIVNISVDALRYYDEIGLLKPCQINEATRYRYYSKEQISELMFILEMKGYGFSLDAIRELLLSQDSSRIEGALHSRRQELQLEHEETLRTIQRLTHRLSSFQGERDTMKDNTVLIVDDVAFMRQILTDILQQHGYAVVGEARTGDEGVRMFNQLQPSLVVMDIHMPEGMDGIQAAQLIIESNPDARIAMLSARAQMDNILGSIRAGAQAFVAKPFQAPQLLDALSDKERYNAERISRWLQDDNVTAQFSGEPLSQEMINSLLTICSMNISDDDADRQLLDLRLDAS
jgi:DNA-binding transcriptional MerR regulator